MKTVKWISHAIGKRKWMIAVSAFLQSVLSLSGVAFALLMKEGIDCATGQDKDGFYRAAILLGALIFGQIVLRWVEKFLEDDTRAAVDNGLRKITFHGMMNSEYGEIKEYHTGELMNRLTSDVLVVTDGAVTLIPNLLSMAVRILGVLFVMFSIEPWMAVVFLAGGVLIALLSALPRKWQKQMHKSVQEADGKVRSFLQEAIESMLVIHAFGCEDKIETENDRKMAFHRKIRRKRSHVVNFFGSGLRLVIQCGYIIGFAWCGLGIVGGTISYGTMTAVIQLIGQIQTPFANIGGTLPKYASMLASAERLMEITEHTTKRELPAPTDKMREEVYESLRRICFENVSFSYDEDRMVLQQESFFINKGELVALIGSSGIGKSTIMKLLLSVYQPKSGRIFLETEEGALLLKELPRGMFAYVPQGNYLMSGSIRQVVGFAEQGKEIDNEKVEWACKIACAKEFIEELPLGYDTVLSERGQSLSEGQMQRLAVARAVYSGCPIMLLDEATSAVDGETEARMIASIKELAGCTVLLVTHRKEAWKLCDRIIERKE